MTLLQLEGMSAGYGDIDIVSDIDLTVNEREIVTVCGTNGAGKSTITKAIMGLLPRWAGRAEFAGRDLKSLRTQDRISLGMSYVPQVANVFPSLSVLENLQVMECVRDRPAQCRRMFELFPALGQRRRMRASELSGGERQQLALARALMCEPKMVIFDEPTAALSPIIVRQIFDIIRELPGLDVAVLVVEQRARQSLGISDRGYILDAGRIVMSGATADLLADPSMGELYLGGATESAATPAIGGASR